MSKFHHKIISAALLMLFFCSTAYAQSVQDCNDPLFSSQTYLKNNLILAMWKTILPSREIVVAIIDNGIFFAHPDLKGKIWTNSGEIPGNNIDDDHNGFVDDKNGWNFLQSNNNINVTSGHGTGIAGIIAAIKNNKLGIAGIADRVKIMPLVACGKDGCPVLSVDKAIRYAVDNGARVINLSIGTAVEFSSTHDKAIRYAWDRGVVVVAAAGNGQINTDKGINTTISPFSPVCNESSPSMIIGVGSSTEDGLKKSPWSNYGKCVDIYAQGECVVSTCPASPSHPSSYNKFDGTSFSAAIVSGVVAYILSAYPEMSNQKIYDYLIRNSDKGILNAKKTVDDIKNTYNPATDGGNKCKIPVIRKLLVSF
jgi:subtilisin family serine protease